MKHLLATLAVLLLPTGLWAEDSKFVNYDAYAAFVDQNIMSRDFIPLINRLGGRDEYTPEQITGVNSQLLAAMPYDFTGAAILKQEKLGGGFIREIRAYWNDRDSYVYYYGLLHENGEQLVVVKFYLNTNSDKIFDKF